MNGVFCAACRKYVESRVIVAMRMNGNEKENLCLACVLGGLQNLIVKKQPRSISSAGLERCGLKAAVLVSVNGSEPVRYESLTAAGKALGIGRSSVAAYLRRPSSGAKSGIKIQRAG